MAENREKRPNWRTGAPNGNQNALKHGRYTRRARMLRARVRELKRRVKAVLAEIESEISP
jgi:uncharacterized protein YjcR